MSDMTVDKEYHAGKMIPRTFEDAILWSMMFGSDLYVELLQLEQCRVIGVKFLCLPCRCCWNFVREWVLKSH